MTSSLRIVFLVVLMDLVGFGLILPLLPLYADTLGAGPYFIGALLSVYSLMQFVINPVWGRLSDRIGRRPVILLSLTGSTASYVLYGLAEHLSSQEAVVLGILFVSRLLAGAMGANIATAQACVADLTPPEQRARGMGMVGAAIGLGFVLGPALGALFTVEPIRERFGLGVPGFVAALICGVNLLWAARSLPESLCDADRAQARGASGPAAWRTALARPGVVVLVGAMFLLTLSFSQFEASFSLLGREAFGLTPTRIGLIFSYLGLIVVIMQGGVTRHAVRRMGEHTVLIVGAVCMGGGMLGVATADATATTLAWLAALGVGLGLAQPAGLGLLSHAAGRSEQGMVLGVGQSMSALARIVGPALGLGLFGSVSIRSPYWAAALFLALVAAGGLYLNVRRLPAASAQAQSSTP